MMPSVKNRLYNSSLRCGIIQKVELYHNVMLAFDQDIDLRLKQVVDNLTSELRENLLVAHECDGALTLLWKNNIPFDFLEGKEVQVLYEDEGIDNWKIVHSTTAKKINFSNSFNYSCSLN